MSIIKSKCSDAKQIADVNKSVLPVYYTQKQFIEFILDINSFVYHVDVNGQIVGYLYGQLEIFENNQLKGHIMSLGVLEQYRRHKYGTQLINQFKSDLIEKNINVITLNVQTGNQKAIKFYYKFGFVRYKVLKNYYDLGDHAYQLQKKI